MSNAALVLPTLMLALGTAGASSAGASRQDSTAPAPASGAVERPAGLEGTKWKLVKIAYGNDTTAVPDDPGRYTIEFLPDGQVAVQADCNRGRGSYTTDGPRLSLNVLAYTRAACPPRLALRPVLAQSQRRRQLRARARPAAPGDEGRRRHPHVRQHAADDAAVTMPPGRRSPRAAGPARTPGVSSRRCSTIGLPIVG